MIYDIPMAREDFLAMDRLVRAFRRGNYNLPSLRLITNAGMMLNIEQQSYVYADETNLGVTFGDSDTREFDIWITPTLKRFDTDFARDTLLHELCHGYFNCYKHGEQFRRYLGRIMYHYQWLISPDFQAEWCVEKMVLRYSRSPEEHQDFEMDALVKAAKDEKDYVARRFEELTNAESLVSLR